VLIIKTARFLSNIKVNNFSGPFTLNQLREFGFRSPEISDIVYDQEQFLSVNTYWHYEMGENRLCLLGCGNLQMGL